MTASRFTFGVLTPGNAFASLFHRREVPLKSPFPSEVSLIGDEENMAFLVDWEQLTDCQRKAVASLVTQKQGGIPEDFLEFMKSGGDLPVRANQIEYTSTSLPFFL